VNGKRKLTVLFVLLTGFFILFERTDFFVKQDILSTDANTTVSHAFENRLSNLQVGGVGRVKSILGDDRKGQKHQRFILELNSGHTVLVAHNIDLAPRVEPLEIGDVVDFYGQYEWNEKGGVIHWTHHDPNNKRTGGWLKKDGKIYR